MQQMPVVSSNVEALHAIERKCVIRRLPETAICQSVQINIRSDADWPRTLVPKVAFLRDFMPIWLPVRFNSIYFCLLSLPQRAFLPLTCGLIIRSSCHHTGAILAYH